MGAFVYRMIYELLDYKMSNEIKMTKRELEIYLDKDLITIEEFNIFWDYITTEGNIALPMKTLARNFAL